MMLPSLAVKVMGYEEQVDIEESTTNKTSTVTVYVTKVEATIDSKIKAVYFLRKRYSDFSALFAALKDRIPDVDNYKFPNKSIFNTNAQFTKDRRLSGFNDLLKLLFTMKPTPMEFGEFLEFGHHLGDNAIHFTAIVRGGEGCHTTPSKPVPNRQLDTPQSIGAAASSSASKARAQVTSYDNRDSFSLPSQTQGVDELFPKKRSSSGSKPTDRKAKQQQILTILKQTFAMTVFFYVCCVVIGRLNLYPSILTFIP